MKKILLLSLFTIFIHHFSSAQVTFQKAYGDSLWELGLSSEPTNDNGYIMAGFTLSASAGNGQDLYLVKTDSTGEIVWAKAYGGSGDDIARCVHQNSDGGYIAVGGTNSFGVSNYDMYVVRTDANGDTLWTRTYGKGATDLAYGGVETNDGGFILGGVSGSEVYLIKTKSNGDTLWTKAYGLAGLNYGTVVQQTADSGYMIAGYTNGYGAGNNDFLLIKTNKTGDIVWAKTYGGSNRDEAYSAKQTKDGGYVLAGLSLSFGAEYVYLVKTDGSGNLEWSNTYGGGGGDDGYAVIETPDGGYAIAGVTFSFGSGGDFYLIKTAVWGTEEWSYNYGATNYDYGYSLHQTSDGGYAIGGYTQSFGSGGYDFMMVKTDATGSSGCLEATAPTNTGSPATLVATLPAISVTAGATVGYTTTAITNIGNAISNCFSLGVQAQPMNQTVSLAVSPNPTSGKFSIALQGGQSKEYKVEILNVLGEIVFEKTISGIGQKLIDLSNHSKGIYFVRATDGQNSYTQKLVIE